MTVYRDYTRARIGWFFGLTGIQLALLAVAVLPVAWSISGRERASAHPATKVTAMDTAATARPAAAGG